jgi:hypothetical protein
MNFQLMCFQIHRKYAIGIPKNVTLKASNGQILLVNLYNFYIRLNIGFFPACNVVERFQSDAIMVTMDLCDVFVALVLLMGMIRCLSDFVEETPLEMPEVECFEALLNVEKALCNNKNMYCFLL